MDKDYKEQNIDQLYDWVMENKFKELEDWCAGHMPLHKDTYEKCLDAYVEDQAEELWDEFIANQPDHG